MGTDTKPEVCRVQLIHEIDLLQDQTSFYSEALNISCVLKCIVAKASTLFHLIMNEFFPCISVFGEDPDFIRDGSTVPVARMFQTIMQKNVMMLPIGAANDGEHSQNEKISRFLLFVDLLYKRRGEN